MTLDIATQWVGGREFRIWPPFLRIAPGCSANVYLQYTAMYVIFVLFVINFVT